LKTDLGLNLRLLRK